MAFTRFTKNVLNVSALPDRVQNQAQTLKATFDQAGVDIKTALNALIAELEASTSADNIGADVQSVATKTVQAILTAFEEAIADRYTKTESETLLAIETNNLLADLDINLTTGVITVTKKDGTAETFDTALEKVPAKFEIVENNGTYALKITNVDGTSTVADITSFMNVYNFNNSDYITFEVTGEGTEKTVIANIKANSIGLDKLSLSVVSTLEGYVNSARDSATAAKTSETNARASELNALEAKNTAVTKANEASASASAAKTSETNAEYWAKQAQAGGGGGGGITEIPVATADTLGGIKVGEGLEITEDGVLSSNSGSINYNDYYTETELLSETVMYSQGGTSGTTIAQDLVLLDDITNYDEIVFNIGATDSEKVINSHPENFKVLVSNVVYNSTTTNIFDGSRFTLSLLAVDRRLGCWFKDSKTLYVHNTYTLSTFNATAYFRINSIKGIKYDVTLLDGTVAVDNTPTEGSSNVVTSGGVYEAIDNMPYKVLEASTDNVIDFNTLTEPGIYLIKAGEAGTILNFYSSSAVNCTIILSVSSSSSMIMQKTYSYAGSLAQPYRIFNNSSWGEWTDLSVHPGYIRNGTFGARVKANATAVATLTDTQVRNIKAQTTDLVAGTSTLATGDIVLIYE